MIFAIVVAVILIPIVLGLLFAAVSSRFDKAAAEAREDAAVPEKGVNPALTLGYEIEPSADSDAQVKQARLLAAKKAAALPRGANMRVGRLGNSNLKTAWQGVENDPFTAAKIAQHHGWAGVKTGFVEGKPVVAATGKSVEVPTKPVELIPGKDYPVIEITDDMTPAEKRKARIANAKAKSAAKKAAKDSTGGAAPAAAAPVVATAASASPAAPAVAVEPPTLIDITDDMSPDEKRKARIANSKAKSAYNKALKAAGADPKAAAASPAKPAPAPETPAPAAPVPESAANLPPKPELVEITDDMSPGEMRQARIANSKAKSAYNKALKAAGIDPKTVTW